MCPPGDRLGGTAGPALHPCGGCQSIPKPPAAGAALPGNALAAQRALQAGVAAAIGPDEMLREA
eukprot:2569800-Lingulodinium_polyedra.AAC.1